MVLMCMRVCMSECVCVYVCYKVFHLLSNLLLDIYDAFQAKCDENNVDKITYKNNDKTNKQTDKKESFHTVVSVLIFVFYITCV